VIIRRSRELRFNQGNYEHIILRAELESDGDIEDWDDLDAELDKALAPDIEKVKKSTSLNAEESFVWDWSKQ
jgi:hypothetical protein